MGQTGNRAFHENLPFHNMTRFCSSMYSSSQFDHYDSSCNKSGSYLIKTYKQNHFNFTMGAVYQEENKQ